jgi:DNA-binding NtrC family response regulator
MAESVKQGGLTPTVVFMGLTEGLAEELAKVLVQVGYTVCLGPLLPRDLALRTIDHTQPDVVFCPAEPEQCAPLLEAMKAARPGLPVVTVSRLPEVSVWLKALELGAADNCAPPFEPAQIQWILQSALHRAAYRALPATSHFC